MATVKIADLVGWKAEEWKAPSDLALVMSLSRIDTSEEQFVKVMWNTGNISNVPLKLIYLVNRSKV